MAERASAFFRVGPAPAEEPGATALFRVGPTAQASQSFYDVSWLPGGEALAGLPVIDTSGPVPVVVPAEIYLGIVHDGVTHHHGELAADETPSVQIQPEGRAFQLALPGATDDVTKPWTGWEVDRGVAPPGADPIDLQAIFEIGSSPQVVPLITGGRTWSSTRDLRGDAPMVLGGGGRMSRYARNLVTYELRVGHGKQHGEIAREILLAAGVPSSLIKIDPSIGEPLTSPLEIRCEPGVEAAFNVLDAYAYVLIEDRDGAFDARPLVPVDEEPLADLDVARAAAEAIGASIEVDSSNVPVCIAVEGQRSEIPDLPEEFVTTERIESEVVEPYARPIAAWFQQGNGTLTAHGGGTEPEEELVTERVVVRETKWQGCLTNRQTIKYRYYNPVRTRRFASSAGSPTGLPYTYLAGIFIFDPAATSADTDTAEAFAFDRPQFMPVEIEEEVFVRDGVDGRHGRLVRSVVAKGGWRLLEAALKFDTAGTQDWPNLNVISSLRLRASGQGIDSLTHVNAGEEFFGGPGFPSGAGTIGGGIFAAVPSTGSSYFLTAGVQTRWLEVADTAIDVVDVETPTSEDRPGGWITGQQQNRQGWARGDEGNSYWFQDGGTSAEQSEGGRFVGRTTQLFVSAGDSHSSVETDYDRYGKLVRKTTTPAAGTLPVADICTLELQGLENSVAVRGQWCILDGEGNLHPDFAQFTETLQFDFGIETASQAARRAREELRFRSAFRIAGSWPFNSTLDTKIPVRISATQRGIDPSASSTPSNAGVEDLEHTRQGRGADMRWTTNAGLIYPVI